MQQNQMVTLNFRDPTGSIRQIRFGDGLRELTHRLDKKDEFRDPLLMGQKIEFETDSKANTVLVKSDLWLGLGDFRVKQIMLKPGMKVKLGETEIAYGDDEETSLDFNLPTNVTKWQTCSESGLELLHQVRRSAQTSLAIYLNGETGSGKEVLANMIHAWSNRASGPFIAINCGALPPNLAESELFGHVKGAFTGAHRDRVGALLQAHNGTLFLDEIGDLLPELQVKLLRFLESGEIRPVGSDRMMHSQVRVICATHKPLQQLVREGKFRQDLYFRLASIPLDVPPLRNRPKDIVHLAKAFATKFEKTVSESALVRLKAYSWPGNVRELRHSIERASGLAGPGMGILQQSHFEFLNFLDPVEEELEMERQNIPTYFEMERLLLMKALSKTGGNRTEAAKILGIARSTLFEMMKRHQFPPARVRGSDVAAKSPIHTKASR